MYASFAGRWPALRFIRSLLVQNDSMYRLPSTVLEQMLRDPSSHRFPRYAGARVFMTIPSRGPPREDKRISTAELSDDRGRLGANLPEQPFAIPRQREMFKYESG